MQRKGGEVSYKIKGPRGIILVIFLFGTLQVSTQAALAMALGSWAFQLFQGIFMFPIIPLSLVIVRWGLMMIHRYLGGIASQKVRLKVRERLFSALFQSGSDEVRFRGQGAYHTLLTDKVEALDPLYSLYLPQLFIGILSPLVVVLVLANRDWYSALVLLAFLPLAPLILGLLRQGFQRVGKEYSEAAAELGSWYSESIKAIPTLTLFQKLTYYRKNFEQNSGALRDKTIGLLKVNQLSLLLIELFFSFTLLAAATYLGITRFRTGMMDGSTAIALPLLAIELIRPINLVGAFFFAGAAGRQAKKTLERTIRGLERENTQTRGGETVSAPKNSRSASPETRCLKVDRLTFGYPRRGSGSPGKIILSDFSMFLKPGEIVGLQGPSGSGKSTLAKVLLGFYQPSEGSIVVNGLDISRYGSDYEGRKRRAGLIGYLPQRPYLFAWSLRDNIRMGDDRISDEKIVESLNRAGLSSFAAGGLDLLLGEDASRISGGERIRIALARVFAHDAPYVILDEPTAEIDSLSELDLWQGFKTSSLGILLIAHRKATLEQCDRIISLPPLEKSKAFVSTPSAQTEVLV